MAIASPEPRALTGVSANKQNLTFTLKVCPKNGPKPPKRADNANILDTSRVDANPRHAWWLMCRLHGLRTAPSTLEWQPCLRTHCNRSQKMGHDRPPTPNQGKKKSSCIHVPDVLKSSVCRRPCLDVPPAWPVEPSYQRPSATGGRAQICVSSVSLANYC